MKQFGQDGPGHELVRWVGKCSSMASDGSATDTSIDGCADDSSHDPDCDSDALASKEQLGEYIQSTAFATTHPTVAEMPSTANAGENHSDPLAAAGRIGILMTRFRMSSPKMIVRQVRLQTRCS